MSATYLRISFISLCLIASVAILPISHRADTPKSVHCSAPEYRQFDFWVGEWNAYDLDAPTIAVAHARVDRILDGCVLREDYRGNDGHAGQSFTIYDASRKIWHQTWVTNDGRLLTIEGQFRDGEMVLSGVDHTAEGLERHVRGVWKAEKDGVRETAVTSVDGGKTWKPWFDLIFRAAVPQTAPKP